MVKISEDSPVWLRASDLDKSGVLLGGFLLFQELDGGLSGFIEFRIHAVVSLFLEVFDLVLKTALISSIGVDSRDNLNKISSNFAIHSNSNIHVRLFLKLHFEYGLMVNLDSLLGEIFAQLSLTAKSEYLDTIVCRQLLLNHIVIY